MRGPAAAQHVRLLGLRADEQRRIERVLSRALLAEGASTAACTVSTQPPGERPYFPLADWGYTEKEVLAFWEERDFDLDIPEGAGNCVFCFMKGTRQLVQLATANGSVGMSGTPSDIGWWADMESRYERIVPARIGPGVSRFGFFGVNSVGFKEIARGECSSGNRYANGTPACDCTD